MTARERICEIPDLKIEQAIVKMKDNELFAFIQILNLFVEKFPLLEAELKKTLEDKDYAGHSKCLSVVRDMLKSMYADDLAEDCQRQIDGLINVNHVKAEAYLNYFISVLAMHSINIQMAIYDENEDEAAGREAQPAPAAAAQQA
ncbi:MAG: hypothetical protein FWG42_10295, partial [Clostridiales bacterium]|nr:hypothetical protein [Clostridiales bacterium]